MKLIDYMKKNKDMTFMFLYYVGSFEGYNGYTRLIQDVNSSRCFRGYDGFVSFKSKCRALYYRVYEPLLEIEIGEDVEPYYVDDSNVVFVFLRLNDGCIRWGGGKHFFEENPILMVPVKEFMREFNCAAQKEG